MTKIEMLTEKWLEIVQQSREQGDQYYEDEVFPVVLEQFVEQNCKYQDCEHMILTVGTQYSSLVLAIKAMKPQKVLFLVTEKSISTFEKVVRLSCLSLSQFERKNVKDNDPASVYKVVKDYYMENNMPDSVYIDITGGTKVMSFGSAMVADVIGAKTIYISTEFNKSGKGVQPGSETLLILESPYYVFGDIERNNAIQLFNQMDYRTAIILLEKLEKRVPGAWELTCLKGLSYAYQEWDAMNFNNAKNHMSEALTMMNRESRAQSDYLLLL